MNYPLISEYVEAIKAAEDNFEQLKHLRPVLDDDGQPMMTSGNFAVVFKMKDEQTGKLHAVKCFLREQEGRAEAYRQIAEELEYVSSTFLTPIKYLDKELFVDTSNSEESEFPVLLMDWVEGQTLDKYIREHINDEYELSLLAYQFSRLAMWLLPQPFAHGDLKPDNILVKEDGTLVLVDYDGMYVPAMKGRKARELGSPDFRHPGRTEDVFDEHIDDFSLVSILLSLKAIALQPELLDQYGASDRLLFSEKDYRNLSESQVMDALKTIMQDTELATLYSLFILSSAQNNLSQTSFRLLNLSRPKEQEMTDEEIDAWYRALEEERAPFDVEESWTFEEFVKKFSLIRFQEGSAYYSVTGGGEDAFYFMNKNGKVIIVYNQSGLTKDNLIIQKDSLIVELRKSGHYILLFSSDKLKIKVTDDDLSSETTDEYLYKKIRQCASVLMHSIEDEQKEELIKNLLHIELTILSAASILDVKNDKNDDWRDFIKQKILNEYLSIKEVGDYDAWIESKTPGMYSNGLYTTEEAISLLEFEKENGGIKFFKGKINAYPYDDSFWGEFVDKNGEKQIIYVDQGFPFEYNVSELLKNKTRLGIVEEKDKFYHSDDVVYCLKIISKEHSMLPFYINERLSFYKEAIEKAMLNCQKVKEYYFQLYNAVINEILNLNNPYLGIDDLVFDDDIAVNNETGETYHYNASSLNNFSTSILENLNNLRLVFMNAKEKKRQIEEAYKELEMAWEAEYLNSDFYQELEDDVIIEEDNYSDDYERNQLLDRLKFFEKFKMYPPDDFDPHHATLQELRDVVEELENAAANAYQKWEEKKMEEDSKRADIALREQRRKEKLWDMSGDDLSLRKDMW